MVKLSIQRLKEILKEINTDPQTAQQYYSRLSRILKFLNNNTGLKNAAVKETGSRAKKTDTRKSDIDVIFCTSPDQDHQIIRNHLLEKATSAFGKAAEVNLSGKAVYVDFKSCKFDLVYLSQMRFKEESKKILVYLKENDYGITKTNLSTNLGMHHNTITKYLNKFEEFNIILKKKIAKRTLYFLNEDLTEALNLNT